MSIGHVRKEDIETFARRNMTTYGLGVNLERAIPDLFDGLKPVQRRIIWGAGEQPADRYVKSARIVGDVLGKYHPHGDVAAYSAMVNMASASMPYIDGSGNWGTLVDPPAAMRYTEAKLSKYGRMFLTKDYIHPEVTDFVPNYDGSEKEPFTLPALLPNLLINGSSGIGWGTTCDIPSFTVDSLVKIMLRLLAREKLNVRDFERTLKPSFPLGGRLVDSDANKANWAKLFRGSEARLEYEAVLQVDEDKRTITIDNWPGTLRPLKFIPRVQAMEECATAYNSKGTLTYTIEAKRGYNLDQFRKFVAKVQRATRSALSYKINVTNRVPKVDGDSVKFDVEFLSLSVAQLVLEWLKQRVALEERSLTYRIGVQQQALDRTNLLLYAVSIKAVIFKSLEQKSPVDYIVKNSELSKDQAQEVLELRVRQLSKLDETEMKARLREQKKVMKQLRAWLRNPRKKVAADLKEAAASLK